jgi:PilZ domain
LLETPDQIPTEAAIQDISRSGMAVALSWPCPAGTLAMVTLPGTRARIEARVIRNDDGVMGLAFRQEPSALASIDAALDAIAAKVA